MLPAVMPWSDAYAQCQLFALKYVAGAVEVMCHLQVRLMA